MPFEYKPFVNRYVGAISDVMGQGAEARNRAALSVAEMQAGAVGRLGDLTADRWRGLGQDVVGGVESYLTEKREAPIRKEKARLRGLDIDLVTQRLAEGDRTLNDYVSQETMDTEARELLQVHMDEGGQFDEALRQKFYLAFGPIDGEARLRPLEPSFTAYAEEQRAATDAIEAANERGLRDLYTQGAASGELTRENFAQMEYLGGRGDSPFADATDAPELVPIPGPGGGPVYGVPEAGGSVYERPPVPPSQAPARPGTLEHFILTKYGPRPTDEQILEGKEIFESDPSPPLQQPIDVAEAETLWGQLQDQGALVTGPASIWPRTWGRMTGTFQEALAARRSMLLSENTVLRALANNPRLAIAEQNRIKNALQIAPNWFDAATTVATNMGVLDGVLKQARVRKLNEGDLETVGAIDEALAMMGVPQPIIVVDSDGTSRSFDTEEQAEAFRSAAPTRGPTPGRDARRDARDVVKMTTPEGEIIFVSPEDVAEARGLGATVTD